MMAATRANPRCDMTPICRTTGRMIYLAPAHPMGANSVPYVSRAVAPAVCQISNISPMMASCYL